ncbi:MAG: polysulfide reductase NrfD [Candidatus Omnitrophica bacterium]|nr:polysulfide reductase NrfD [Candidatus Omnitrophota bacterium]
MTSYDIFHNIALNWMIPTYFFLGGLSAGLFFIAVAFTYWKTDYKTLAQPAAILSPLVLAAGMGLLTMDLGHPLKFWRLMVTFQPSSAASWGTWLLSIFFMVNAYFAYLLIKGEDAKAKRIGYAGLPLAFCGATYTGFLLAQMQGRALWHTALMPWLFLVGSVITALALVILISIVLGKAEALKDKFFLLGRTLAWLVVLEVAMIAIEILVLLNGGTDAIAGAKVLLKGNYSFLFWVVEIFLGAVVPLSILFNRDRSRKLSLQSIAAALILIGIFAMRFIVVMAGQI